MHEWFESIVKLFSDNPDLEALLAGACLSWPPAMLIEPWLPSRLIGKRLRGTLNLITVLSSLIVTFTMWMMLDMGDDWKHVLIISVFAAIAAPAFHHLMAMILSHYVPWINSEFAAKDDKP